MSEGPSIPPGDADSDVDGVAEKKYERSKIKFPYTDIDDAVLVAERTKQTYGTRCTVDQLAAVLNQKTTSGAFRTKLATAQTFGAVDVSRREILLTDLGHRLVDEHTRAAAMVEAFLRVPLYQELYKRYGGKSLPGDSGLEGDISSLGVVANQADRARQVFQRSAEKAGLFFAGRTRLVIPPAVTLASSPAVSEVSVGQDQSAPIEKRGGALSNPLLRGLWEMLPDEGPFTAKDRARFFRALAVNLDMVYGEPTDGQLDPHKLVELWKINLSADAMRG